MVAQWLKAGVVENGRLSRTEEGTPQGGVISPVLLNVALHGMEEAAGVRYQNDRQPRRLDAAGSPALIRYADDLVALCHSRHEALEVKARLAGWLAPRGLAFNEDKTRVVSLDEGFDFLGFNVRRYRSKLLIKPSKAAVRRIRERLRTELRSLRGSNAPAVIKTLNPIIRGWAAYYRAAGIQQDVRLAGQLPVAAHVQMGQVQPSNKPTRWVVARYYGRFNTTRHDRWVFGDRESGAYLHKFAWTRIVRHQMVTGAASPDDPALTEYWAERRRKHHPCRSTRPACGFSKPRMVAARSAGTRWFRRRPATEPARVGTMAGTTRKTITKVTIREDSTPDENEPV